MKRSGETDDEITALAQRMREMISASWMSQAIYVAAELRIADFLVKGARTEQELAALTQTHEGALRRLLRALTTIDFCRELEDGSFEVTPLGSLLATDAPYSLRSWALWWGAQLWPVWGQLLYSVRTGQSARKLLLGTEGFGHLERDPALARIFHGAAAELTKLTAIDVVRAYDFSGLDRIVDVGGGCGELLAAVLLAAPAARGVLFDLPPAVELGRAQLETLGLAARCEFVAGSFLDSVPAGGDVYILKSVIHDWNGADCQRILRNCRKAMGGGRILLIEEMLPEHLTNSRAHQAVACSDLTMLAALAAQERTDAELRELLASAGFRVVRVLPAGPTFRIIEALPEPWLT